MATRSIRSVSRDKTDDLLNKIVTSWPHARPADAAMGAQMGDSGLEGTATSMASRRSEGAGSPAAAHSHLAGSAGSCDTAGGVGGVGGASSRSGGVGSGGAGCGVRRSGGDGKEGGVGGACSRSGGVGSGGAEWGVRRSGGEGGASFFDPSQRSRIEAVLGASPAAAAAAYPAVLRFQQSSGTPVLDLPESIPLDPGTEYVVGRADEEGRSLIPLHSASQEGMVSRKHAFISFSTQEGAWHVVDNNSTNGMILNGQRVSQALLKDGMCVCACMRMCVLVGQSYHSSTEIEERRRCDHLRRRQIHRAQRHSFQQSYKEHLQFHLSAGVTPDTLRRSYSKERTRMF
jgi:hypothetical protein